MLLFHLISMLGKTNNIDRIFLLFRQCAVCRGSLKSVPAVTISEKDRDELFINSNIFIPKGSRCCRGHYIFEDRLPAEVLNSIRPRGVIDTPLSSNDVLTWFNKFRQYCTSICYFDFDPPFNMSEFDWRVQIKLQLHK